MSEFSLHIEPPSYIYMRGSRIFVGLGGGGGGPSPNDRKKL